LSYGHWGPLRGVPVQQTRAGRPFRPCLPHCTVLRASLALQNCQASLPPSGCAGQRTRHAALRIGMHRAGAGRPECAAAAPCGAHASLRHSAGTAAESMPGPPCVGAVCSYPRVTAQTLPATAAWTGPARVHVACPLHKPSQNNRQPVATARTNVLHAQSKGT
jgi:hypothetical protein